MSKFAELVAKLDQIPHLNLGKKYDADILQWELSKIDPALFVPFRSKSRHKDRIAECWHGLSLVAPHGSIHDDLTEEEYAGRTDSTWTPVAHSSPYIKQVITELGGEGQRVRLNRLGAGKSLTWHRHGSELSMIAGVAATGQRRPNWYELIVHVPVLSNDSVSYEVIATHVYELADFASGELEINRKTYPQGEAWAFNSAHYHNVFNRSDKDRYAIMMTLDIRMRRTFDIVSAAVERYIANGEGPLMPAR
ncbi:aspartyl/asparaginyl beta-hydroxylase domain-containing protein [Bradyrhizobium sp. SZCCHNR3118]|uniref:aspartyl/asparaginyl beta-hydroxylase domain-containing protein n=1 Tax=Bradyrhizobium sp. SZCCHNR3118 TaxID=3057468 RepID=UPI002916FA84|nr:aspartyl/asparaginyl beta-hydroxylase domain-containing protein [Bradyrhizobium sp. SZCCHNR3118]